MVAVSDQDKVRAKLKELPLSTLDLIERYVTHRDSAEEIAADEKIGVSAVYKRIEAVEKLLGVPLPRHGRGPDRKRMAS